MLQVSAGCDVFAFDQGCTAVSEGSCHGRPMCWNARSGGNSSGSCAVRMQNGGSACVLCGASTTPAATAAAPLLETQRLKNRVHRNSGRIHVWPQSAMAKLRPGGHR